MPKYDTRLLERRTIAEGTMSFSFERPAGFHFKAGQFVTLIFLDPPHTDAGGNRRSFTIASGPQEAGRLEIATRITENALKRSLAEAPAGTPLQVSGPFGGFTLHEDASVPAVLIAGGIGITPFRSMARDAAARRLAHRITLIYSNRNPEGAAYHEEFRSMAEALPNLHYVPTMTRAHTSRRSWDGERSYVDAAFLREHVDDLARSIFYVAGSPRLVAGVSKAVLEAGVDPGRLLSDEFEGY